MLCTDELGKQGEALAVQCLEKQGCHILHTRWHHHHYELDIVATDGKELIVAEVKTRSSFDWGEPADAVDYKKIMRSVYAADFYMKLFNVQLPVRFDIFSIVIDKQGHTDIDHIKDAFYPPLG